MSDTTITDTPALSSLPELHPDYVVGEDGERRAVLLSIAEYKALLERIEDLQDAMALDLAVSNAKEFLSGDEVEADLRARGLL
jgi:hypothetical protein